MALRKYTIRLINSCKETLVHTYVCIFSAEHVSSGKVGDKNFLHGDAAFC